MSESVTRQPRGDAHELVAALTGAGLTIAIAESLTGGALAAELVAVPGASRALAGGIVAYRTQLKRTLLGVDGEHLALRGAVDEGTAIMMAAGVRDACAVDGKRPDIGLSTTGVAGPGTQEGKPVGTVFIGVDAPWGASSSELRLASLVLPGDPQRSRARIRRATVEAAITEALAHLAAR